MTGMNGSRARPLSIAAAFALILAGAFASGPARAQDFTLKFGTQTLNDIQHEYMKVYKTELEKATNGKIKVEVYPASQLGAIGAMLSGIRVGTIEGLVGPAELYVGIDTRYQALAMAGLFKSIDHARRVFDLPEARREIFAIGEQRGLVTIGLTPYDLQVFNTKQPVAKLADFSGKRIRVLASE